MAKKNNFNNRKKERKTVDVDYKEVKEQEELKHTFETGNYVVSIVSNGDIIKKVAVAGAEIYIQKLADGGLTVDLK